MSASCFTARLEEQQRAELATALRVAKHASMGASAWVAELATLIGDRFLGDFAAPTAPP
ncbi:hypothetical protein ACFWP2_37930 [Kitasatospora sp. NPDC058444]|uniref:hypothetical protein n=1 Tax=Kitasatospora sp. NPDC058444 TaxID=3346504 RepID=UPI0036466017